MPKSEPTLNEQMHTANNLPPKITKETLNALENSKKNQYFTIIKCILYTFLSSLLVSFSAYSLIAPNNFTIGGVSGIAILISIATKGAIPQSIAVFCLNAPLVLLAFFLVKKRFALLSALNILFQSISLLLIEQFLPDFHITFPGGEASKIFSALAAGLCVGAAISLAFKVGGSTGGADILAVLIQKKLAASSIARMLFIINCVVIVSSLFVFPLPNKEETGALYYGVMFMPVIIAAFEAYIESKTNEALMNGLHSAREFRIITSKPDLMASILMHELKRGVTAIPVTGMYTKEDRTMLSCIVNRRQVATLKRIIKAVDPDSFAIMSNVSQVIGLGFYSEDI